MDSSDSSDRWNDLYVKPLTKEEIINLEKYIYKQKIDSEQVKPPLVKKGEEDTKTIVSLPTKPSTTPIIFNPNEKKGGTVFNLPVQQNPRDQIRIIATSKLPTQTLIILFSLNNTNTGRITKPDGTTFDTHFFLFDTANSNSTPLNLFIQHYDSRILGLSNPAVLRSNLYDSRDSIQENAIVITAPDLNHAGITFNNSTAPVPLHRFAFLNCVPGSIHIGICEAPRHYIHAVNHTAPDIQVMRCITYHWDKVMNPWLYLDGQTNNAAFLADPNVVGELTPAGRAGLAAGNCRTTAGYLNQVRLRQEMINKIDQYDTFLYNKGRISTSIVGQAVIYEPPAIEIGTNAHGDQCNNVVFTSTLYRGMSRPYAVVPGLAAIYNPAGTYYRVLNYCHTSVSTATAIQFAGFGPTRIIYRFTIQGNIPYWVYDNNLLSSRFQECEIIFARHCILQVTTYARVIPGFNGIPVEDVNLWWHETPPYTNIPPPPFPAGELGIDRVAKIHLARRVDLNKSSLYVCADLAAIYTGIDAIVGNPIAAHGGKTKKYKKKRTKRYLKLKKNKTI